LSKALIGGLVASAIGFVLRLSYFTYHDVNGVRVDCDYRNFGPLLVGPVAIVLGLVAMAGSRKSREPARELGLGLLCVAVGALHIVRGLGMLDFDITGGNPC
jgi:hypothetical protein